MIFTRIKYYGKLSWRDIKTQPSIYLPYALMISICLCFQYIAQYMNIHSNYTTLKMGKTLTPIILGMSNTIFFILVAVLLWTFSITLRRQQTRRQGLYRILGLTRSNLLVLNAVETLGLAFASLVFGTILCFVFGQLLFMIAGRFANQQLVDSIGIDFSLLLGLWIFYIGIHLVIVLRDSVFIVRHNPLKMLRKEKSQELPKAKLFNTIIGIVLLGVAYTISLSVDDLYTSISVLLWAVTMVIIGTYFLYNGAVIYLLRTLQNRKRIYYHPKRMLSISNLLFRLRSYATSMASITILLSMLILTFSMCTSLYSGIESTVKKDFMDFEFKLYGVIDGNKQIKSEYTKYLNEEDISKMVKKHDLTIEKDVKVAIVQTMNTVALRNKTMLMGAVFASGDDAGIYEETDKSLGIDAFGLDGYNAIASEKVTLKDDEVLLLTNYPIDTIKVRMLEEDGKEEIINFKVKRKPLKQDLSSKDVIMIVSDEKADLFYQYLYGVYDDELKRLESSYHYISLKGDKADKLAFGKELQNREFDINSEDYYSTLDATFAMYGSFMFLGILFCIIFIFSIFLILYYRMQEDLYENKRQFSILYRIGLTKKEIAKEFSREQRIIILTPPVLAIIHCLFAYPSFHEFSSIFEFGEGSFSLEILLLCCFFVIIVFVIYHTLLQMMLRKRIIVK